MFHIFTSLNQARTFFYWRLRRRLEEFSIRNKIRETIPNMSLLEASQTLKSWFEASSLTTSGSPNLDPRHAVLQHVREYYSINSLALWASPVFAIALIVVCDSQDWEDDKSVLNWMADSESTIEVRKVDAYTPFSHDVHSLISSTVMVFSHTLKH